MAWPACRSRGTAASAEMLPAPGEFSPGSAASRSGRSQSREAFPFIRAGVQTFSKASAPDDGFGGPRPGVSLCQLPPDLPGSPSVQLPLR
eukprot:CAMPEP_0118967592 /NCGR_PEP_ID=MMETSP1173-20130426/4961_1 /TAXON_ID=1034831 /ORGANISM="Rhizochromulina marina cf, Strain CCMP1243" /LENGTH=89 /DNA_ID=CAMNT_0006916591 /DNA_START=270 /DNA_END=539 /DNA_ORIENTATION=-